MVVSKRCKICTVLDTDNIPISGEYFGKLLPELIAKISGVELDPRKANGVLICQSCAIQLVHTGSVVDKLRNTLQRLKKLEPKSKTPSKASATSKTEKTEDGETETKTPKKIVRRKSVFPDEKLFNNDDDEVNGDEEIKSETSEIDSQTNTQDPKPANKTTNTPKNVVTPKKVVRRKSVLPDDKQMNDDEDKLNKEENQTESNEIDSQTNREDSKPSNTSITKPLKKIVKSKSEISDDKQLNGEEINLEKSKKDEITTPANLNESKAKKQVKPATPKKVVKPKETTENKINNSSYEEEKRKKDTSSGPIANSKFKKMLDDKVKTPVKKTPTKATKRKLTSSNDDSSNTSQNISSPMKRTKTESISMNEESAIDCTIDENDGNISNNDISVTENKVKVMNCIICGKAFHQKSALRDHIETSHMGERLKSCPHCSSEFRSQQKYESHVFSEKCKNTNHVCQYPKCNKRFKTVHKMEMHMHEKHSSQNEYEDE